MFKHKRRKTLEKEFKVRSLGLASLNPSGDLGLRFLGKTSTTFKLDQINTNRAV